MHGSISSPSSTEGPNAQRKLYVVFVAAVAGLSGFLFGFDTAVINGVLLFLRHQFALNDLQTEIAASALLLGCLLGAAGASLIGDRFGRRKSLSISAFLFAVSTLASALAPNVVLFSIGRLIAGIAIGIASVLTPMYISEVAPAKIRGTLVSMNQLAIVVGILVAYLTNWKLAALGDSSWRWMLGIATVPAAAFFLGLLAIPESPRWLITHGQTEKGQQVLSRIFGAEQASEQARLIDLAHTEEGEGSWQELFSTAMRSRLTIAVVLALACQLTGINTVLYYGSILMAEHAKGLHAGTALGANVAIGAINLIGTLIAMYFLDRWGRRPMLLTATAGMFLSLVLLVVSVSITGVPPAVMLCAVLLYVGFFAFGMGPIPWVVISEIFPNGVRGRAVSLATSALWTGCLLVTFTALSLVKRFGISGTFGLFALLSFLSLLYIHANVRETRGRTLEEIQEGLG
jgi:SP family arabinose:H+ symporter-like MFS transporter